MDDPNKIVIPETRTPDKVVKMLSYVMKDNTAANMSKSPPLFGGHESWKQREESFKIKPTMKVIYFTSIAMAYLLTLLCIQHLLDGLDIFLYSYA